MLSRKPFTKATLAWIGIIALFAPLGAWAAINLDADPQVGIKYAQETITKSLQGNDGVTYYVVDGGTDLLDTTAALGFGTTPSASLVVRYDFNGMILTGDSAPDLTFGDAANVALRQGGKAKDNYVVFLVTGLPDAVTGDSPPSLVLTLEDAAISRGGGSIMMHVKDDLAIPAENVASQTGAITMTSALMPVKVKRYPVASVDEKFLMFVAGDGPADDTANMVASVGSVVVNEVLPMMQHADGEGIVEPGELIADTGSPTANTETPDSESSVIFKGDFSFAMSVTLKENPTAVDDPICTAGGNNLMMMKKDDGTRDTTRLRTQSLSYVNDNPNLCIMVHSGDMAMAIPATDPYIVEKNIVLVGALADNSKFTPMPDPAELGAIRRDGTTVRLPYLTQYPLYNQRIVVANRSGVAAQYSFDFMAEDGVTITRGPRADGMLMPNSLTYFSLSNNDLVRIEGSPNRAAATFIVGTQKNNIDVLISQTNEGGSTDTVTYTETDR